MYMYTYNNNNTRVYKQLDHLRRSPHNTLNVFVIWNMIVSSLSVRTARLHFFAADLYVLVAPSVGYFLPRIIAISVGKHYGNMKVCYMIMSEQL